MLKPRLLSTAMTCLTLGIPAALANTTTQADLRHVLDWVPLAALTDTQKSTLAPGSCGAYIAPLRTDVDAELNPKKAPIRAMAKRAALHEEGGNKDNKQMLLIGDVIVTQGYRQVKAQRAHLNQGSSTLMMQGELELREPGLLVLGDATVVNYEQNLLTVDNANYALHEPSVRGAAGHIVKDGAATLTLEQASFTRCEPGNNTWLLKGSRIILNQEARQGHAKHVTLEVKGIPILYLPYLRFPIGSGRLSGFLAPSYSREEDGVNIAIPYYFNLAPNYDLLLTTSFLPQHGVLYDSQFRHLSRYFDTQLKTAYLFDDRGKVDEDDQSQIDAGGLTEVEVVPFKGEDRWLVSLDQIGTVGSRWSSYIHYTEASDIDYVRDFDPSDVDDNDGDYLDQRIGVNYTHRHWQARIEALRYQILNQSITTPYTELPTLSLDGRYTLGKTENTYWDLSLNNEWAKFDHQDAEGEAPVLTGSRLRTNYGFAWHFEPEWGFLESNVRLQHLQYQLADNNFVDNIDQSPSVTVPQASLGAGLFFERDGNGYLQTFEPRLFYFYSDFESHDALFDLTVNGQDVDFDTSELTFSYSQLFRDTRFSGGDRIDDANQLALGLTTRFFSNKSGREWFSASLGQINYFADRRVTLTNVTETNNRSAIAGQLSSRPSADWLLSGDFLYDDDRHEISKGSIKLRYQTASKHLLGINYRFVRDSIDTALSTTELSNTESVNTEQVDASIIAPLFNDRWHLLLYSQYDLNEGRELDTLSAIEYNGCCYRIRVGYRSELDNSLTNTIADSELEYDYSAFFEFHFKGLGGTGKKLDTLLDENIDGYAEWQAIYNQ